MHSSQPMLVVGIGGIMWIQAHVCSKWNKKNFLECYGEWAVVTGCTDGIGKEYSFELAERRMNIVLVGRNNVKLETCAKEIGEKYGVKTEIVQADFSEGRPVYKKIEEALADKDIGILVNNVGTGQGGVKRFLEVTEDDMWDVMNVNVVSVPAMVKMVLPSMMEKKRGAIVNVASLAACCPLPHLSMYSASKAFVDFISTAVGFEYKKYGIFMQTLCPGTTYTNMTKCRVNQPSFWVPDAKTYAKAAVNTIGLSEWTTGYWKFELQCWAMKFLPRQIIMSSFTPTIP